MEKAHLIMLVDNNGDDLVLFERAFEAAQISNPVHLARHPDECLAYVRGEGAFRDRNIYPMPSVIVLDMMFPMEMAFGLLAELRSRPETKDIPVIALGISNGGRFAQRAFDAGANAFFDKGLDIFALVRVIRDLEFVGDILQSGQTRQNSAA
jgi:CheY-like chemotaxis protein